MSRRNHHRGQLSENEPSQHATQECAIQKASIPLCCVLGAQGCSHTPRNSSIPGSVRFADFERPRSIVRVGTSSLDGKRVGREDVLRRGSGVAFARTKSGPAVLASRCVFAENARNHRRSDVVVADAGRGLSRLHLSDQPRSIRVSELSWDRLRRLQLSCHGRLYTSRWNSKRRDEQRVDRSLGTSPTM